MSIHVALNHLTHYRYDRPVGLSPQIVRLRPAPHCRTRILSYSLRVAPADHFINWQQDPEANFLARLVFPDETRELRIEVDLVAEMSVYNPFDFFLAPYAEKAPFKYESTERRELAPYLVRLPVSPLVAAYLAGVSTEPRRTIDFLVDLNRRVAGDIRYLIRLEPGVQSPEETLEKRSGSCRDSAALLVQLLRHLGLAARFVSGYLIQLVPDVKSLDGPSGPSQDFTDLHAWCEVYLPGAGWIGLDPTSGLLAGEGHIPLACTPEPSGAAPVVGRGRRMRNRVRTSDERAAHLGSPARDQAVFRDRVDRDRGAGGRGRCGSAGAGCASHDGRRADIRRDRRSGRRRVEHCRARAQQAPLRRRPISPLATKIRAAGTCAFRAGQVVSGRAIAALVVELLLAQGRRADLGESRTDRRSSAPIYGASDVRLAALSRRASPRSWASIRNTCFRLTRTRSITCGKSAACRSTSIHSNPSSRIRSSARGSPRSSSRGSTRSSATCCRSRTAPTACAGRPAPGFCAASAAI